MKFKVGDEVEVANGCFKGSTGFIDEVDVDDELPYHIRGVSWHEESELTLKSKVEIPSTPKDESSDQSKMNFEITAPNGILNFKVETEYPNEIQDAYDEITRLSGVIASLESELLSLYRELHCTPKE